MTWSWFYAVIGYAVGTLGWPCRGFRQLLVMQSVRVVLGWPGHGFTQLLVTQSERVVGLVVDLHSCRLRSRYAGFAWSWLYVESL